LHVHDLFGLAIFIEMLPGVAINAYSNCVLKDGKPRIRLTQPARNAHPSSLIAAAMMLPKPRRERHETHGANLIRWEQFVVQTIRLDVASRADGVLVRPVTVRLENADGLLLDISFAERMARVVRVWAAAATPQESIANAVRAHASAFTSVTSTQAQLAGSFAALHAALSRPAGDMLPLLESHFGLSLPSTLPVGNISAEVADEDYAEEVHVEPAEARVERVRQWRLAAVRGGSAANFRKKVREAYDCRCLFSGQRLPRIDATTTAGVDAAHILPWSRFDLDATKNGICLNKQCHWAFDEGLFRLSFDERSSAYVVSIPNPVRLAAQAAHFDIGPFDAVAGLIPKNRLPGNEAFWPSKQYLAELNRFLDDDEA
jgi:hypothetical protein